MTKIVFWVSIVAIAVVLITGSIAVGPSAFADDDDHDKKKVKKGNERVSVTVRYDEITLEPGEATVLLDTTGSGTLFGLHVAANLPCGEGPTAGGGNDAPDILIVAGVAGGAVGTIIESTSDDTGFVGPNNTCIFHDTSAALPFDGVNSVTLADETVTSITDVILINLGPDPVTLPSGTTITVTGTYAK